MKVKSAGVLIYQQTVYLELPTKHHSTLKAFGIGLQPRTNKSLIYPNLCLVPGPDDLDGQVGGVRALPVPVVHVHLGLAAQVGHLLQLGVVEAPELKVSVARRGGVKIELYVSV